MGRARAAVCEIGSWRRRSSSVLERSHVYGVGRRWPALDLQLKRASEPAQLGDGSRVLVERLWPRGLTRERAPIDESARELAPSDALRRWYGHDPKPFGEFRDRYLRELSSERERLAGVRRRARVLGTVTLVFATREPRLSNAPVLASVLRGGLR
jgi:uncharacterized protein YeaO (DUF488 family)